MTIHPVVFKLQACVILMGIQQGSKCNWQIMVLFCGNTAWRFNTADIKTYSCTHTAGVQ